MMNDEFDQEDDQQLGRLLRAAGLREQVPAALQQRWEENFRGALHAQGKRRQRRRWSLAVSLAAGIAAMAVGLYLSLDGSSPAPPLIRVVAVSGELTGSAGRQLLPGEELLPGEGVTSGVEGRAALTWAGYDLRLNRGTRVELRADGVFLHSGEIYLSDSAGGIQLQRITVHTAHGVIRDIGTQFTVAADSRATVARVRRGLIELSAAGTTHRAQASRGLAGQLSIDINRRVSTATAPASGVGWRWIYLASPGFELEGSSALAFLEWSAGESGLELVFASPAARAQALRTTLHGSLAGLDPEQAVAPVLAATDLVAQSRDGKLHISLQAR